MADPSSILVSDWDVADSDPQEAAWWQELIATQERARQRLAECVRPDGHWCGELQGDTILESETILLLAILGRRDDSRIPLLANYLRQNQLADGGWSNYPGGPPEVSVSVKAYFALKIAGDDPAAPHMRRAAAAIRALGGAEACNSFTRFYLAMLGQIPYSACPTVPPELVLLPRWFPINIYAMSAWSRTIFVPLAVVHAYRPVTPLPAELHIGELFLSPPESWPVARPASRWLSWSQAFLWLDRLLKWCEHRRWTPLRRRAVRKALDWIRQHTEGSDGIGAIYPPIVYYALVLHCLQTSPDDPEMQWVLAQLDALTIREEDTLRLQPCLSPVWDTALSLIALSDAGLAADHPLIQNGVRWLLQREIRTPGDWAVRVRDAEPSGWCFEYRNRFYPDVDDTAMVLIALSRAGGTNRPEAAAASERAIRWLLAMQNRNGGWGAFDRDVENPLLEKVPFADHNAMLDPACPDITARVLEALGGYGLGVGHPAIDRAIRFILDRQEEHGGWFGRWGVNYIYGTWQVLAGLAASGYDMRTPPVRRAVRWLKEVQNADGGWGESCRSYDDPSWAGCGPSTASQTAWAVLGLLAAGEGHSPEVRAGIEYLVGTQASHGDWKETAFTGTGFPRVFYLRYHMYPLYFPLMAISRYRRLHMERVTQDNNKHRGRHDLGHAASAPLGLTRPANATPRDGYRGNDTR